MGILDKLNNLEILGELAKLKERADKLETTISIADYLYRHPDLVDAAEELVQKHREAQPAE